MRVFLIVLDSFGIGTAPDAADFGDVGANTLVSVAAHPNFHCPQMQSLGLFNLDGVTAGEKVSAPRGGFDVSISCSFSGRNARTRGRSATRFFSPL